MWWWPPASAKAARSRRFARLRATALPKARGKANATASVVPGCMSGCSAAMHRTCTGPWRTRCPFASAAKVERRVTGRSRTQLVTAPQATGTEDGSASTGGLASTEAVLHGSLAVVRLEGALHRSSPGSQRWMAVENDSHRRSALGAWSRSESSDHDRVTRDRPSNCTGAGGGRGAILAREVPRSVYGHRKGTGTGRRSNARGDSGRVQPFPQMEW